MLRKLKIKVLNYIKNFLENEEYSEYSPIKCRNLKAVAFDSKHPLGKGKYNEILFQCTEWNNGEGFDFNINHSIGNRELHLSLHMDEIEGIITCLNDMNYFNIYE